MNKVVEYLDKVASSLEQKGLLREAEEIDIISNTLEAMDKEAVAIQNTAIARHLNNMIKSRDKVTLSMGFKAIDGSGLFESLGTTGDQNIEQAVAAYDLAKHLFEKDSTKIDEVVGQLRIALQSFMAAKDTVEQTTSYRGQQNVGQPLAPKGDLIFTSKKPGLGQGAPANKPPVINPALRRQGL